MLGPSTASSSTISEQPAGPPLPPREASRVLVMFSGGSDSSLTASLLSERHTVVHLITYNHQAMWFDDKSLHSLAYLRKAHGEHKFVHQFISIKDLMGRIFFRP